MIPECSAPSERTDDRLRHLYGMGLELNLQVTQEVLDAKYDCPHLNCSEAFGVFIDALLESRDMGIKDSARMRAHAFWKLRTYLRQNRLKGGSTR